MLLAPQALLRFMDQLFPDALPLVVDVDRKVGKISACLILCQCGVSRCSRYR